ncbi:MAG: DNA repair protein RecN [Acetivibrionales bacterium]
MLIHLEIHNIALIDTVIIDFEEGLNILTGETGAGKSIIIDSINAVLGERFSKDFIRTGKEKARVEAVFKVDYKKVEDILEKTGIEPEEDSTLIISREFNMSGKNICRVNGIIVTVSILRQIGERLIDIHGQHDNQSLLRTQSHIELLDSFGGDNIEFLKRKYLATYEEYRQVKNRLKSLMGDKKERERKIDLLKFQIEEISKAGLKLGEEEELNRQRLLLSNSEKITAALAKAYMHIYNRDGRETAFDNIGQAMDEIAQITGINEKYDNLYRRLEDILYQLEDLSHEIREESEKIEFDPEQLNQIEERMDLIFKLKRKYGSSVEEILEYYKSIECQLDEIVNSEENIKNLCSKLMEIDNCLYNIAGRINAERLKAAAILENEIGNELGDLEMGKARFKVSIEFDDSRDENNEIKYHLNGLDRVEFLISPNAGEPLKPLSKIVSGGEMSRIMLAIKNILAKADKIPTLIFDEIDSGVSGRVAQKVGEKLSSISESHQVLCVTHLAQIAAMADSHYLIKKVTKENETRTLVRKLAGEEIQDEIARILGGVEISDITKRHAEEMLSNAKKLK